MIGAFTRAEIWDAQAWQRYQDEHEDTTPRRRRRCCPACSEPDEGERDGTRPRVRSTRMPCRPRRRPWRTFPGARSAASGRRRGIRAGGAGRWPGQRGAAAEGTVRRRGAGRWVVGQHPDASGGRAGWGQARPRRPAPRRRAARARAAPTGPAVLVDATLGLGGHAAALLAAHPQLTLVGLDRDPEALALAGRRLAAHADRIAPRARRVRPHRRRAGRAGASPGSTACCSTSACRRCSSTRTSAGFSYSRDADLDMRMDPTTGPTAADVLNTYPVPELARVLREYGEERFAGRIAAAVARRRAAGAAAAQRASWSSCCTRRCRPRPGAPAATRPSGRSRRCGSRSTASWTRCGPPCPAAIDALAVGGRIVVLAYHSLEDRIVKRELAERAPRRARRSDLPVELPGHGPELRLLTRGAEQAGDGRDRRQPAGRLGAAARRRTDPGGGSVSTAEPVGAAAVDGRAACRQRGQR